VVEAPRISRQAAHENDKIVVSPTHQPLLPSISYSWYSFLLQAELTPGPLNIVGIHLVQSQFIGRRLRVERPVNFCSIPRVGRFPFSTALLPTVGSTYHPVQNILRNVSLE
jgi:hypothetical protein